MTTVQYILIIIAVVIMVVGLYMIVRAILNRKRGTAAQTDIEYKDGVPIIPRHQRQLPEETEYEDEYQDEYKHKVLEEGIEGDLQSVGHHQENPHFGAEYDDEPYTEDKADISRTTDGMPLNYADTHTHVSINQSNPQAAPTSESVRERNDIAPAMNADVDGIHVEHDPEDDLFSSLVSATESLMPVIETAEEPDFKENSPVLDSHLLAEADQDQNSPLNHAQENINITLVPKNQMEMISGKTVLSLVSQYGLKYGAMNMFHRYEQKDGTGILWFSMMGITEEGDITPFDLNLLPNARFKGLVLFLSLPHPKAMQGFDSMMSVVNLIANDLNTLVLDENNDVLTRERRQQLRAQVQEYQASFKPHS